jgi:hypothetical protein
MTHGTQDRNEPGISLCISFHMWPFFDGISYHILLLRNAESGIWLEVYCWCYNSTHSGFQPGEKHSALKKLNVNHWKTNNFTRSLFIGKTFRNLSCWVMWLFAITAEFAEHCDSFKQFCILDAPKRYFPIGRKVKFACNYLLLCALVNFIFILTGAGGTKTVKNDL